MDEDSIQLAGNWRYPTAIRFGAGRIDELADVCREHGIARPLVVTDSGLAKTSMVSAALSRNEVAGMPTSLFSDVKSNPIGENITDGLEAFRTGRHDGIIAFGGGSVIDAAKLIALLAKQKGAFWEALSQVEQIVNDEVVPVVAIPTTAGTGSEVGRAAVVTRVEMQTKEIILHAGMMPNVVIADPELTIGLPPFLTAATGMDALAHNLEALCAPFCHPMADGIAIEGIRLTHKWLLIAVKDGSHLVARSAMMAAATMGATAFQKGLGAIHAMSHPIGAIYDTHHGLTNAVVMPYVLQYNRSAIEAKMERLARYLNLGEPGFQAVLQWVLNLREKLGIPHTLRDLGVEEEHLAILAQKAAVDPCAPENPVEVGETELLTLFQKSYHGDLAI